MSNPPLPPNNLGMNSSMTDGDAVSLLQTLGMILTPYQDQSNAHIQMQMYMQMQQQLQQMAAVNTMNAAHHAHAQAQAAAAVSNQASMGRGMSLSLPGHPQTSNPLLPPSSQHAMSSSLPFPTNPFTTHTSPPTRSPESSPHSSDEHISHHSYPSDGSREEEDENWQQQQSQSQSQQHGTSYTNTTHAPSRVRNRERDHNHAPVLSRQSTITSTTSSSSGSSHSHSSNTRMSPSPDAPTSSSSSRPTSFQNSTSSSRPSESPLSSESPSQSSPSPPIANNNSRATFPFLPGLAALAAPQPKKKRNPKKPGLTREQRLHNRKLAHRQIDANRRLRLAAGFAQLQAVVQPNAAQPLSQIQLLRRSSTLMLELTSERERLQQLLQQMAEDRKEREAGGSGDGQQTKKIKIKREKHMKQEQQQQQQQQQQMDGGEQVTSDGHQDEQQHVQDAHLHPDDQQQVRARSISHPVSSSSSSFPTSMSLPTLSSWQDSHGHSAHPSHTSHPHPQLNPTYPHDGHMDSAFVNPLQQSMAFALMQQQGHSLGYPHPHAANNTPALSSAPNHMHMSMPMSMHMPMAMSMPLAMPIHHHPPHPHPHHPHPHPHHSSHPSTSDPSHMSPFTSPSMSRRSLGTHPVAEADPNTKITTTTNSINDPNTN